MTTVQVDEAEIAHDHGSAARVPGGEIQSRPAGFATAAGDVQRREVP
jgi:hypothetical protein